MDNVTPENQREVTKLVKIRVNMTSEREREREKVVYSVCEVVVVIMMYRVFLGGGFWKFLNPTSYMVTSHERLCLEFVEIDRMKRKIKRKFYYS